MTKSNEGLEVKLVDDQIVISIGVEALAVAAPYAIDGAFGDFRESTAAVCNARILAADVVKELRHEGEDGMTPVHRMLDEAIRGAHEAGSEGLTL